MVMDFLPGLSDYGLDLGGLMESTSGILSDTTFPAAEMTGLMSGIPGGDWLGGAAMPGPAGGPASWLSDLGSNIGGFAEKALPFVKAGIGAGNIYAGIKGMEYAGEQQKALQDAQRRSAAAAAPGIEAAGKLIPAGTSAMLGGPLPPQLEAEVEQFRATKKAELRQALASMGIADPAMIAAAEQRIDAEAIGMRNKLAAALLGSGVGAVPSGVAGQDARIAEAGVTSANQAVRSAQEALYNLLGRQG